MKTKYRIARAQRAIVMVLFILALTWPLPIQAQATDPNDPWPPQPGSPAMPRRLAQHGLGANPASRQALQPGSPPQGSAGPIVQLAGDPEYYGYTWADTTANYNWIDAISGGTNTGLSNSKCMTSSLPLPFPFKFYENTYSSIYVSRQGYVTFTDGNVCVPWEEAPREIPPNNVIAPYWTYLYFAGGSSIYYRSGGTAPDRYFVVEWNQMNAGVLGDPGSPWGIYTFEAVLYENGNIIYQYHTINHLLQGVQVHTGIEDMRGYDGLQPSRNNFYPSGTALTYTRPAAASRVLVYPHAYGAFAMPGEVASITLPLKNIGDVGSDTFDLEPVCSWPVTLRDGTTHAALSDTNANGFVDTGPVGQGASFSVLAEVQMPAVGNVGLSNECSINVTPAQTPAKSREAKISVAYPAAFAEINGTNNDGAMNLSVVEPQAQTSRSYAGGSHGYAPAVAETQTGNFVTAWVVERCGATCGSHFSEIYYAILDKNGSVVKGATKLADLSSLTPEAYDQDPAIAVAPDGTIGIVFYRERYNASGQFNDNIHLAQIDQAGSLLRIANVTNNTAYGNLAGHNRVGLFEPAVAATSDNRFTVAWTTFLETSSPAKENVATAVWSTGGAQVVSPVTITTNLNWFDGYASPNLAASGVNVVFVYRMERYITPDIYYQVRSSAGATVKSEVNLTAPYSITSKYRPDVVALSDGHFLVAWDTGTFIWENTNTTSTLGWIQFDMLDETFTETGYRRTLPKVSRSRDGYVSLAADKNGRGILSWIDWWSGSMVNYALVSSSGLILTPSMPMKFQDGGVQVSNTGNTITSRAVAAPTTSQVDLYLKGPATVPIFPGTTQALKVNMGNLGTGVAADVTVTMTQSAGLSLGTVTPAATCVGDTCTWTFTAANLEFQGSGLLTIPVSMGSVPPGTAYTLTMHIASAETDAFPANNDLTIMVVSAYKMTLPAVMR